jgi:hypothetical protein
MGLGSEVIVSFLPKYDWEVIKSVCGHQKLFLVENTLQISRALSCLRIGVLSWLRSGIVGLVYCNADSR